MGERDREQSTQQLLISMADTTWRMFTPPALTVALGLWADNSWQTGPWMTLLSMIVGLGGSVMLVKRQLKGY
ncbi:AtpZ/AtpI family protein [bacterium]|nr:MAG: AtpZ/AtpI family protein [bacterium]